MRLRTRTLAAPLLPLALVALSACDIKDPLEGVNLRLALTDATVEIPAAAGTVEVRTDRSTVSSGVADNDTDIVEVEELMAIKLQPAFFGLDAAGDGSSVAEADIAPQSGTIQLFVFLGGVPLPQTPITLTVEENVVVSVEPSTIDISTASVEAAAVADFIASLSPEDVPELNPWFTPAQVVAQINAVLAAESIPITIGVITTGSLTGSLTLDQIAFDAEVIITDD